MNKRFKSICVLAAILVTAAMITACGGPTPSEAAGSFFKGIKAQDASAIEKAYDGKAKWVGTEDLESAFSVGDTKLTKSQKKVISNLTERLLKFSYQVTDEQIDGDKATVKVTFTTYKFGNMITSVFTDFKAEAVDRAVAGKTYSDKDLTRMVINELKANNATLTDKNKKKTVTVNLKKTGGRWKVTKMSAEAVDAMLGGIVTALETINDATDTGSEE